MRNKGILEIPKIPTFRKKTNPPSKSRVLNEIDKRHLLKRAWKQPQHAEPTLVHSSFPNFANNSVQINIQATVKHEVKKSKATNMVVSQTPTVMSSVSEASIISGVTSVKSTIKKVIKTEDSPSFYQRLVIPFSGFTETDVKEITGGKESLKSKSRSIKRDQRPVLKKYQSEKRKSSYDRYMKEHLENIRQTRNNTEDSSYNTVLAVKMMVNSATKLEEIISPITLENNENNSRDTIYIPMSEIVSTRFDRKMDHPSAGYTPNAENHLDPENRIPKNADIFKSNSTDHKQDQRSNLMNIKKEIEQVDKEFETIRNEYDEAERAFFTAKLNFHRMKLKRDKLFAQLKNMEKHSSPTTKYQNSDFHQLDR